MENLSIYQVLSKIQTELKAPKSQFNKFGGYAYRSCEDITEAVKPLLEKFSVCLLLSDEIEQVGDRCYVVATATLKSDMGEIVTKARAREPLSKKGMDEAQITGATSSYARKYALNGLFAIDDTKDSDYTNKHEATTQTPPRQNTQPRRIDSKQLEILSNLLDQLTQLGWGGQDEFFKWLGVNSLNEITQNNFYKAKKGLETKLKQEAKDA